MYHGTEILPEMVYVPTYNPHSINPYGERRILQAVQRHVYVCDACRKRYAFTSEAEEAFFCSCNALISITKE